MKRKFFTLLAAAFALGTSAYAQCPDSLEVAATSITNGEFYYLRYTDGGATDYSVDMNSDKYFAITKVASGDSVIAVDKANMPAKLDSVIWQVIKLDDKYYSFKNKATGNTLTLDAGTSASASKFGWNFETAGTPDKLSFINDFKNYQVQVDAQDTVSMEETASNGVNVYPTLPGWKALTLGELNAMYSDYFQLFDLSATSETDQAQASHKAIQSKFHATDLGTTENVDTTRYFLNVVGTETFLNVDTIYYNRIGLLDSTQMLGGHVLTLDTLAAEKDSCTYQFTIWKNIKDSIAIQVWGIPVIAASGETFADNATTHIADTASAWITLSSYDAGFEKTALTAAAGCFNANMPNPKFSLNKGLGKQIEEGYYYIYKGLTTDSMFVATLTYKMEDEYYGWIPAQSGKEYVAAAQWYVPETSYLPFVFNRESTKDPLVEGVSKFYEVIDADGNVVENAYEVVGAAGIDTITMVPFESVDKYLGYKKFGATEAEEKITEVYLQFNTKITGEAQNAYIVNSTYATDSLLKVRVMDKELSRAYKIEAIDTFSIGRDILEAVSYKLYYTEGNHNYYVAGYEGAADQVKHTAEADSADTYLFRSTYSNGKYQILTVADTAVGTVTAPANRIDLTVGSSQPTLNSRTITDQVSVAATSAEVYNNTELHLLNGTWSFVNTLDPEYLTLNAGHYRIYSSENSSLAVTVNPADSSAILKAETDVPGYENAWFSLYVDPFETDTVRPTYMIGTTQQGLISDEEREAGHIFYMVNAGQFGAPINAETTGNDSISFVNAVRFGEERDSISFYAADTIQATKALSDTTNVYFAFRKVTDGQDNEAYIECVNGNGDTGYLAQSNGVLYFNNGTSGVPALTNALKFVFGEPNQDVVTSNDDLTVNQVAVIAVQGGVKIAGAAGKKVVVSNILGQTVANTVITSDNAVIAAPQGVVVVAVEGEEAVKAIVK
ncbi:DUF6383 domain-containing protein [uncultured Parabacteroides sp.]|uniref:DUF6383 domain-containing protein n=1 Tax=uncultured Parabacteroides sp. TaxID=512312 RepID=UPI0026DB70F4|nr:DUF6383 domain-containing protein [uncultured Parabacteroides sp.]